ncbi:DUF4376 domain-containing protein [Stutzerimonas xanthomarina]|uniref:DUF4376 domain-containing protein n=2 Tax=Stutzerimonas xanthomarina TaxID=271420 RepID=A0A1M5MS85_9GAMM|nr:DUF4376 domain-containing protein [Stutzerimonas xanthomarina]MCP9337649.1 DUF4376 domain-containing protein [Stutzerimonas xanthomarina]SEH86689.1 protein of unknown function [Stutzerimonas xanthomarina]SHG80158.1 protein of unknown function [Stutzerimonas xanthomarina DSM 18231]
MSIDWSQLITAEDKTAQARQALVADIAARRWQAETAGITVNGIAIDTGRDSQALITGAAVSAMLDSAYALRWKTPAGFVDLEGQQIIAMATTVRAHVQAAFDREADLLQALADGTFLDKMLEEGWPGAGRG